jgi:hypothetical protein
MEKWLNVNVIGYSGIREVLVMGFIQETIIHTIQRIILRVIHTTIDPLLRLEMKP